MGDSRAVVLLLLVRQPHVHSPGRSDIDFFWIITGTLDLRAVVMYQGWMRQGNTVVLSTSKTELFHPLHECVSQCGCFFVHGWEYLCRIESCKTTFSFKHPKCSGTTSPLQC